MQDLRLPFIAIVVAGVVGVAWFHVPQDAVAKIDVQKLASIMPASGGDIDLVSHKALYDYKMISVESGAGVSGIKGRMYYEQDDACDAWTTDQRFTTEYQYPERRPLLNNSHYVAWEAKDGSTFQFSSERQENGVPTEQLRGNVDRATSGVTKAIYSRPEDLSFDLPQGYYLPIFHTQEIIRHAKNGDKLFNAILFDGTDDDGPVEMNTFIGKKATPEEIKKYAAAASGKIDMALLTKDAWHVRIALFPMKDEDAVTPSYEMEMVLHDNGVVSYAVVDYQTFKVEQSLSALEKLPAKTCP